MEPTSDSSWAPGDPADAHENSLHGNERRADASHHASASARLFNDVFRIRFLATIDPGCADQRGLRVASTAGLAVIRGSAVSRRSSA